MCCFLFSGGLVRAWNWGSVEECILKLKGDQGDATFFGSQMILLLYWHVQRMCLIITCKGHCLQLGTEFIDAHSACLYGNIVCLHGN